MELRFIRNIPVGTAVDHLLATGMGAVERRIEVAFDETGAPRIRVSVDHLH